jgi:hypothetical protein
MASGTAMSAVARAAGAVVSLSVLALILAAVPDGTRTLRAYHLAWTAMAVTAAVVLAVSCTVRGRSDLSDSV